MPHRLPFAALLPLLAAVGLAQPPVPKPQPAPLTAAERLELLGKLRATSQAGVTAHGAGKTAEALTAFEEMLAVARRLYPVADYPDGHANLAVALANAGTVSHDLRKWAAAESLLTEALAVRKRLAKGDQPEVARSLDLLARLYLSQGKWAVAEPLFADALDLRKRLFRDRDHPDVAASLGNLAFVWQSLGKRAAAEPLFREALAMLRRLHAGDHPAVAAAMNNLGLLDKELGKWDAAESLSTDALAMLRRLHAGDHPNVARSLNSLAFIYQAQNKWAAAEPLFGEALAMRRRLHTGDHPDIAQSLNNLAFLDQSQGKWANARRPLTDALAMWKRLYPNDHPDVAAALSNLGALDLIQGKLAGEPRLKDALAMRTRLLADVAVSQSEDDQIGFRASLRYVLDTWLTAGANRRAVERYTEVLAWKGSAFTRQAQLRAAVLEANDPASSKLFAERIELARRFANLTADAPPADRMAAHGKALKELADRKDEIERELARKSEPFRRARETAALTPDRLAQALPADAALVDYLGYKHWIPDPAKKGRWLAERRLLAFVVRNGKPVAEVELKASAPIEEAVTAWRQAIGRGVGNGGKDDPAAVLRRLVWEPVAKHLGDAKTVLISPDGALGRLPFAALPGADPKKYLLEEVAIAVVPVPQLIPEMLSAKPDAAAKPSLLVVGGVDFDADAGTPTADTDARAAVRAGSAGKWGELAGTADEAKAVSAAFTERFPDGKATNLTGKGATEAEVRGAVAGRRMLHFATHGFFAPPPPEPKTPAGFDDGLMTRTRAIGVHPGLQCGLVLAGANKPPKVGADDGILTALEVAGLDLRGVDLAVLSACETGLGKDAGGEGVLGLQRAFQAAGARRVVSSLWKVPDQSTAALMGRFYQHLWTDRQPPAEALRQAQLDLLRNPDKVGGWAKEFRRGATADGPDKPPAKDGRLPPRAWAAFTLSGDWR